MDTEERLLEQVALSKSVSVDQKVWIYRNSVCVRDGRRSLITFSTAPTRP